VEYINSSGRDTYGIEHKKSSQDAMLRQTEFTTNGSLTILGSDREATTQMDLRNFSRDSTSNVMNHLNFMTSGYLDKERDKISS